MSAADALYVQLGGELDIATVDAARAAVLAALEPEATVLIDVMQVTFMDSAALSMFAEAAETADAMGARLRLINPARPVGRLLELTELHRLLLEPPPVSVADLIRRARGLAALPH